MSVRRQGSGQRNRVNRRTMLASTAAAAAGVSSAFWAHTGSGDGTSDSGSSGSGSLPPSPFQFKPFQVNLPIPEVIAPVGSLSPPPGQVFHGIAPEYVDVSQFQQVGTTKFYVQEIKEVTGEIIPGVQTPLFGYSGKVPGPTFIARIGEPVVVRYINKLNVENSIHLHGAHTPAHADGYPDFYVLPGKARDYFYPNTVPKENGNFDFNESTSTMWYHDHGLDITGHNANRGLAGFYLTTDAREDNLIADKVLPGGYGQFDIPLVIQDKRFNADGSLFYDFLDHNGLIGDVMVVNGKAQPKLEVQRRKYRFRILTAGNARVWGLRLSNAQKFLVIGNDSWLLPRAVEESILVQSPAQRTDVIIDFRNAPNEFYLENVMRQDDGRKPNGIDLNRRTPLLKFIVKGTAVNNASVTAGTALRPNTPIHASEIVATRTFVFERQNGAWKINERFFDPLRADAVPRLGGAERWILKNKSGGWWHPIHIHLESHQVQKANSGVQRPRIGLKSDTTLLGDDGEAEIFIKTRTFTGPFVFHCHNLEHEDMRMMTSFDPRPQGTTRPLDANGRPFIPEAVSGVPAGSDDHLFGEQVSDLDRLRDRDQGLIGEIRAP